jgi:hypothetical protein
MYILAQEEMNLKPSIKSMPNGQQGNFFAHIQDWITAKRKDKVAVKDISTAVLVKGIKQWAVFEEKSGAQKVRTVFKIT